VLRTNGLRAVAGIATDLRLTPKADLTFFTNR